jgi:hypothetical protein
MPYPRRDTSALPTPPPLRPHYTPAPAEPAREFPPDDPFPSARKDRRKPTWLFLSLGVLLVLALIIAGTWWVGRSSETVAAPPSPSASVPSGAPAPVQGTAPTPAPPAALEDRLPTLPGTPSVNDSTMSLAKGAELDLYPQASVQKFTDNTATEVVSRASTDGQDAYFLLAFPTKSAANAQAIVSYLGLGAVSGGFTKTSDSRFTVTGDKQGRSMMGTWYASGDVAITLWVSQPSGGSEPALTDKLNRTLSALQLKLPLG